MNKSRRTLVIFVGVTWEHRLITGVVDEDLVSWMVAWILRYRFLPCHFFVQREYFYHLLEDVNSQFSWNIESLYFII